MCSSFPRTILPIPLDLPTQCWNQHRRKACVKKYQKRGDRHNRLKHKLKHFLNHLILAGKNLKLICKGILANIDVLFTDSTKPLKSSFDIRILTLNPSPIHVYLTAIETKRACLLNIGTFVGSFQQSWDLLGVGTRNFRICGWIVWWILLR